MNVFQQHNRAVLFITDQELKKALCEEICRKEDAQKLEKETARKMKGELVPSAVKIKHTV